jgi:hypothetical protein
MFLSKKGVPVTRRGARLTARGDAQQRERSIPILMRAARGAYARSIRAQLHSLGIDDLPRN